MAEDEEEDDDGGCSGLMDIFESACLSFFKKRQGMGRVGRG